MEGRKPLKRGASRGLPLASTPAPVARPAPSCLSPPPCNLSGPASLHLKGRAAPGALNGRTPGGPAGFGHICIAGADAGPFLLKEVLIWDKRPGIRSWRGRD